MIGRQFEFRGWDTEENKMIYGNDLFRTDKYNRTLGVDLEGNALCLDNETYYPSIDKAYNVILMQSTGFFDDELTEIFEGDVICFKDIKYNVYFNNEKGAWFCGDYLMLSELSVDEYNDGIILDAFVIGNIYENEL